jgi:hypothetical protein
LIEVKETVVVPTPSTTNAHRKWKPNFQSFQVVIIIDALRSILLVLTFPKINILMLSAAPDTEASGGNIIVAPEDTVPPKVEFRDRTVTDKYWGALYALFYVVYLSLGFVLVSQSKNPYTYSENGVRTGIADHYLEDVQKCCDDGLASGICFFYYDDGRRLQSGNSKFSGDEGIFDAFIEAPEIIFGLTALTLGKFDCGTFLFLSRLIVCLF